MVGSARSSAAAHSAAMNPNLSVTCSFASDAATFFKNAFSISSSLVPRSNSRNRARSHNSSGASSCRGPRGISSPNRPRSSRSARIRGPPPRSTGPTRTISFAISSRNSGLYFVYFPDNSHQPFRIEPYLVRSPESGGTPGPHLASGECQARAGTWRADGWHRTDESPGCVCIRALSSLGGQLPWLFWWWSRCRQRDVGSGCGKAGGRSWGVVGGRRVGVAGGGGAKGDQGGGGKEAAVAAIRAGAMLVM